MILVCLLRSRKVVAHVLGCADRTISEYTAHEPRIPPLGGNNIENNIFKRVLQLWEFPAFIEGPFIPKGPQTQIIYREATFAWKLLLCIDRFLDSLVRNKGFYNVNGVWVQTVPDLELWLPDVTTEPGKFRFYAKLPDGSLVEAKFRISPSVTQLIPPPPELTRNATELYRTVPLTQLVTLLEHGLRRDQTEQSSESPLAQGD